MNVLEQVVTIQEAAMMYLRSEDTIRYHLDAGNLQYRKTPRIYLITLDSLINLYGIPLKTPDSWVQRPA